MSRAITVFVRRVGGVFVAAHGSTETVHPSSATLAVRLCASKYFDVSEELIELTTVSEHLMLAAVIEPSRTRINWGLILTAVASAIAVLFGLGVAGLFVWAGKVLP